MDKPGCYYRILTYDFSKKDNGEYEWVFTNVPLEHEREDTGFYFHPASYFMKCYVPDYYDIDKAHTQLKERVLANHKETLAELEQKMNDIKKGEAAFKAFIVPPTE